MHISLFPDGFRHPPLKVMTPRLRTADLECDTLQTKAFLLSLPESCALCMDHVIGTEATTRNKIIVAVTELIQ